jgi:hypothetical protein
LRTVIKRLADRTLLIVALVLAWKVALLVFFQLPVLNNDSFFYDGAVVNLLLHGQYANPSLAPALLYSGTQIFTAYPPVYQGVLLGWMWVFGTSALSAMVLHLLLFGAYMGVLLAVMRAVKLPQWAASVAALFLFAITFHDRPDSLGHLFGMGAIYCGIRARLAAKTGGRAMSWAWMMVALAVLCAATGPQLGALYILALWAIAIAGVIYTGQGMPLVPMVALLAIPIGLVLLVVFAFPHLWAGFMEHANQTSSLTGLRMPKFDQILKAIRTAPGVLGMALALGGMLIMRSKTSEVTEPTLRAVTIGCAIATLSIVGASLFLLTPNSVLFSAYLQPLIVGCGLTVLAQQLPWMRKRLLASAFIALALLGSVRAIGLSTWGVACARDYSYAQATARVKTEIGSAPPGSNAVLSSAFLYAAAPAKHVRWIHSDWMQPGVRGEEPKDWDSFLKLRPSLILLTQFDYYRRFDVVIERLKGQPSLAVVTVENTANLRPPDAYKRWQRVVQHFSWAPVVVKITWTGQDVLSSAVSSREAAR